MITCKDLFEVIRKEMHSMEIDHMLHAFDKWERYTGSPAGEAAVDYILERLQEAGIPSHTEEYEPLVSLPLHAEVQVLGENGFLIPAIADVFSTDAFDLEGELYIDRPGNLTKNEERQRLSEYCGKIVLSTGGRIRGDFVLKAKAAGALDVLHMAPEDNPCIMHGTIGCVWGTPTQNTLSNTKLLPCAGIFKKDGDRLYELADTGPVHLRINIRMDTGFRKSRIPVADIKGKRDEFVLIAGHYDSWYQGITDNAVADAIMVQIAKALYKHADKLERSVRIIWWSGHSDARFAGSAWYADTHWDELHNKCVYYLNLDIAGCKGSDKLPLIPVTTGMEGFEYHSELIEYVNGAKPAYQAPMVRGADESFWGPGVPLTHMAFTTDPGWWYHTSEDLLDKVDLKMAMRDANYYLLAALDVINSEALPVRMTRFVEQAITELEKIGDTLSSDFDISPALNAFSKAKGKIAALENEMAGRNAAETDPVVIRIAGELSRICWSNGSAYEHDPAGGGMESRMLGGFCCASGVTRENASTEDYVTIKTQFIRFRNRICGELADLCEMTDYQLLRWSMDSNRRSD